MGAVTIVGDTVRSELYFDVQITPAGAALDRKEDIGTRTAKE